MSGLEESVLGAYKPEVGNPHACAAARLTSRKGRGCHSHRQYHGQCHCGQPVKQRAAGRGQIEPASIICATPLRGEHTADVANNASKLDFTIAVALMRPVLFNIESDLCAAESLSELHYF